MEAPKYELKVGDVRRTLAEIPDGSVSMCATSPPYWSLRDYGHPDQIGLEPTPEEYVASLVSVFREVRRTLHDSGVLLLNLGDCYCNSGTRNNGTGLDGKRRGGVSDTDGTWADATDTYRDIRHALKDHGIKHKDLIGIPWMVAFALRADGWYLRSAAVWEKPSAMPESVESRPTTAHEYVFLLAKSNDYFWDADAIRKPSAATTLNRDLYSRVAASGSKGHIADGAGDDSRATVGLGGEHRGPQYAVKHDHETPSNPLGRNYRTSDPWVDSLPMASAAMRAQADHIDHVARNGGVMLDEDGLPLAFYVAAKPFKGAHFAVWPPTLVEPMVLAGSSAHGVCSKCMAPWERQSEKEPDNTGYSNGPGGKKRFDERGNKASDRSTLATVARYRVSTVGWSQTCSCDAPIRRAVVLDPFAGSCTTLMVAMQHGRDAIGCELNQEYAEIGRKRLDRPHAPVERASKPDDGILSMFEEDAA